MTALVLAEPTQVQREALEDLILHAEQVHAFALAAIGDARRIRAEIAASRARRGQTMARSSGEVGLGYPAYLPVGNRKG